MEVRYYTPEERSLLPSQPGIYQYYDAQGKLLYVGKAKNLKKRVASYFTSQSKASRKTYKMVQKIAKISFSIAHDEYEALLLENNLIKTLQPKFNMLLKDGKSYPYLCVTDEPFPRVIKTRQITPKQGTYYGPFTSTTQLDQLMELIRRLYPLRTCRYNLSPDNIASKKFKVCLQYHIKNCMGPCEGLQTEEEYQHYIDAVHNLLKGNLQALIASIKKKIKEAVAQYAFKQAYLYKQQLEALEAYHVRSLVANPRWGALDVLALIDMEEKAFVSYLYIRKGMVIFAQTITLQKKMEETPRRAPRARPLPFSSQSGQ